jgi:hypothetical protein
MKKFNEFLIERTMNGDIYMAIGRAFMSLDRMLNFAQENNLAEVEKILNQQLDNLNRAKSEYSQNMRSDSTDRLGYNLEDTTRQLGQIFIKFYDYFQNLRRQLQKQNVDFVSLINQIKNDLEKDYQLAISLIIAK